MTRRMAVLKSQKDQIYLDITNAGLDPSEFQWVEVQSTTRKETVVSKLIHKATDFYFLFDHGPDSPYGSHLFERAPAPGMPLDRQYSGGWELVKRGFAEWLATLKLELEAPDYWSNLAGQAALAGLAGANLEGNEPFSSQDREALQIALSEVRSFLEKQESIAQEHWHSISSQLDYVLDASGRLGRKDWLHLTIGALVSVFTSGAFAPEQAYVYLQYALNALRLALLGVGLLSPPTT